MVFVFAKFKFPDMFCSKERGVINVLEITDIYTPKEVQWFKQYKTIFELIVIAPS